MCWIGAAASSDSMLPTTGLVGGCGIGLSLLLDAIVGLSPDLLLRNQRHPRMSAFALTREVRALGGAFAPLTCAPRRMGRLHPLPHPSRPAQEGAHLRMTTSVFASPKPLSTPFDQFAAHLIRLFLLRPMAAVPHQIFFQIGNDLLQAVGRR